MLELERGADGREQSTGFSKGVHQTSPRPCGGGKSVGTRPALAGGKACGLLPVDALPRPRRSGLSLFASFSLSAAAAGPRLWGAGAGAPAGELPAGSRGGAPLELVEVLARQPGLEPAPAAPPGGPSEST